MSSGVIGSGLAIFSKWPIRKAFYHRYVASGKVGKILHGEWLNGKGVALMQIQHPSGKIIDLYDTHVKTQMI